MANKTTTLQVTQATHDLIMQIKIARHLDSADEVIRALLPSVKRKGAGKAPHSPFSVDHQDHQSAGFEGSVGAPKAPSKRKAKP